MISDRPIDVVVLGAAGDLGTRRLLPHLEALAAGVICVDLVRPPGTPYGSWIQADATKSSELDRHLGESTRHTPMYVSLPPSLHLAALDALFDSGHDLVYLEKGLARADDLRHARSLAQRYSATLYPVDHYLAAPSLASLIRWVSAPVAHDERRVRIDGWAVESGRIADDRIGALDDGVGPDLLVHLLAVLQGAIGDLGELVILSATARRYRSAAIKAPTYIQCELGRGSDVQARLTVGFGAASTVKFIHAERDGQGATAKFKEGILKVGDETPLEFRSPSGEIVDAYEVIVDRVLSHEPATSATLESTIGVLRALERIERSLEWADDYEVGAFPDQRTVRPEH